MRNLSNICLILMFILLSISTKAQYVMEWAVPFGGDGWDEANTCIQTSDGDIMLGGFAKQQQYNIWIVKARSDGRGRWGKVVPDYFASSCNSMIQDRDGNIVLTGYCIKKNEFQKDLLVMKIDTLGNVLWRKTYGGKGDEEGKQIIQTKSGGYAVCGSTTSNQDGDYNWYVLRIDKSGNLLWDEQYGMGGEDCANSLTETFDNGLLVTGYLGNAAGGGQKLMAIVKFDIGGNSEWTQWYENNDWSCGTAIIQTRDSMIMAAGYTKMFSITDYDVLVVKTDLHGDTLWTRTFGNEDWQEATSIIETYDKAFVVGGYSMSNRKDQSSFLMLKYDSRGNLVWHNMFKRKSQDYAKSIVETHDHGLLLAGTTFSFGKGWDMAVLKMKIQETTDLAFTFPTDSVSTTLLDNVTFSMCLKSFGVPNDVKVLVNNKVQLVDSEFKAPPEDQKSSGCDFPLSYNIMLEPGINKIDVEVRDYKMHKFSKKLVVYRLPAYDFVR
ncbi:MAG: hypothetical protein MJZ66_08810 [Bacteroidales bacterium]|nr:hypothetical protein [Bacteroidales bacterium]